jgi:hypothetical protein
MVIRHVALQFNDSSYAYYSKKIGGDDIVAEKLLRMQLLPDLNKYNEC